MPPRTGRLYSLGVTRCTNFSNLFWNETLHVSDSSSVHHQALFTVHSGMVYVIQVCRQLSSRIKILLESCYARNFEVEMWDILQCRDITQVSWTSANWLWMYWSCCVQDVAYKIGKYVLNIEHLLNFLIIKPTRCTNFSTFILEMKLYMFRTVPLSIIRSYSLYTKQWYMSYRFVDNFRAGSRCSLIYFPFPGTLAEFVREYGLWSTTLHVCVWFRW
jgi:hypothetical protein